MRNGVAKTNLDAYIKLFQYHKRIYKMGLIEAIMEYIKI
ncbi:hypothetical protein HRbin01_01726 [archaeon HR01]|nr:hypothetical protein HRbin01_01726 [archaeon HR01]